jgi:hypothetical protein
MKVCVLTAVLLFAPFLHAERFTCSVLTVDAPPVVRSEGLRQLIGDIELQCSGGLTTAPGAPVPTMIVGVQLNTAVTGPFLYPSNSPLLNASIVVDNPAPANIVFNPTTPDSLAGYSGDILGNGAGINFNSGQVPNAFYGTATNANGLAFYVPIDPAAGSRTFKIQNILVDGSQFAAGTLPADVIASISVKAPAFNEDQAFEAMVIASVRSTLHSFFQPSAASHQFPLNFGLLGAVPVLPAGPPQTISFVGNPGAMITSGPANAGLSDFGTRLKATFNNIPNGVNIFVSVIPTSTSAKAINEPFLQCAPASHGNSSSATGLNSHGSRHNRLLEIACNEWKRNRGLASATSRSGP